MPSLPLRLGMADEWSQEVKRVQYGLRTLGYSVGAVEGVYNAELSAAVKQFREDHSTKEFSGDKWTGYSDQLMIRKLGQLPE